MKYENEEEIRKDFARIFDWYIRKNSYGYTNQNDYQQLCLIDGIRVFFGKFTRLTNKELCI